MFSIGQNVSNWDIEVILPLEEKKPFIELYEVAQNDIKGFLKVFNVQACLEFCYSKNKTSAMDIMRSYMTFFDYERNIMDYCNDKRIGHVLRCIDKGTITNVEGMVIHPMEYIVYEQKGQKLDTFLKFTNKIGDVASLHVLVEKLQSLHDVTSGLQQLHQYSIAHQSLIPNNIHLYKQISGPHADTKIGGIASAFYIKTPNGETELVCPYIESQYFGEYDYAAPEAAFPNVNPDFKDWQFKMDNYMLGGLIVYYISGHSFNALMSNYLPGHSMCNFLSSKLTLLEALPDLKNAYDKALLDFGKNISSKQIRDKLVEIVSYLCQPDPTKRKHSSIGDSYKGSESDLQRTREELDLLKRKVEIELLS